MISMIWAMDENWLIGSKNRLPWRYPTDLAHFRKETEDQIVLMGDLTYQSLKTYFKTKPLPFKKVFVATTKEKSYPDAVRVNDILKFVKETKDDLFVVGGRTIYQLLLPYTDRLFITFILKRHEGDIYFPSFDLSKFKCVSKRLEENLIFAVYERIKS